MRAHVSKPPKTGRDRYPELVAPDATFIRQRWLPAPAVELAKRAHKILLAHGAMGGVRTYPNRPGARGRARKLIRYMVELRLHERWELVERTQRRDDGWAWIVELSGRRDGDR
jgi:hypothetical protein